MHFCRTPLSRAPQLDGTQTAEHQSFYQPYCNWNTKNLNTSHLQKNLDFWRKRSLARRQHEFLQIHLEKLRPELISARWNKFDWSAFNGVDRRLSNHLVSSRSFLNGQILFHHTKREKLSIKTFLHTIKCCSHMTYSPVRAVSDLKNSPRPIVLFSFLYWFTNSSNKNHCGKQKGRKKNQCFKAQEKEAA